MGFQAINFYSLVYPVRFYQTYFWENSTSFFAQLIVIIATTLMVFSRNLVSFLIFKLNLFLQKNVQFSDKVCEMRTKIFAFFRESFCSLETLVEQKEFMQSIELVETENYKWVGLTWLVHLAVLRVLLA